MTLIWDYIIKFNCFTSSVINLSQSLQKQQRQKLFVIMISEYSILEYILLGSIDLQPKLSKMPTQMIQMALSILVPYILS